MRNMYKKVIFLILLLISLFYIIPVAMMILGSFKTQEEVLPLSLSLPKSLEFDNYIHVFKTGEILRGYKNSTIITVSSVFLVCLLGALTGIIISRRKSRGSNLVYYYFLFGLTTTVQMVTTYSLILKLHLYGSYLSVILIFTAVNLPFSILSFSSFVHGIPSDIDNAAILDGSSVCDLVFRVLLPIMKPITVTNIVIVSISVWNNFQIPLYMMSSASKTTIPMMVFNFYGLYNRSWQYVFAALVITVLPVVILFLLLQKYIIGGMTSGAVKG